MNALPTLVRREFWEHRQLWIVPLICSAIIYMEIGRASCRERV